MKMILTYCTLFLSVLSWAQTQTAPVKTQEAAPEIVTENSNAPLTLEESLKLRDPFSPLEMDLAAQFENSLIPELERYPVDKFRLIGIITGTKKNKAMLLTPDGKIHIVTENTKIGLRQGRVTMITRGSIRVEERVLNILGQAEKVISKIELEDKDKGKNL